MEEVSTLMYRDIKDYTIYVIFEIYSFPLVYNVILYRNVTENEFFQNRLKRLEKDKNINPCKIAKNGILPFTIPIQ